MARLEVGLGALLIAVSCTVASEPPTPRERLKPLPTSGPARVADIRETDGASQIPVDQLPDALEEHVLAHVSETTSSPRSAARIVRAEAVTWNDGALGCPSPGMVYTQNLVPGYRIVAETGGREYIYHTDRKSVVVLCSDRKPPRHGLEPRQEDR